MWAEPNAAERYGPLQCDEKAEKPTPAQQRYYRLGSKRPIPWNFQNVTFVLSLVIQFAVVVFSVVAWVYQTVRSDELERKLPEVLTTILALETVVQIIEFVWYLAIGISYYYYCTSWGVEWRYLDWWFSTPTMLITLLFFVRYLNDPCLTNAQLRSPENFGWFLALIVVADWFMLLCGLSYEIDPNDKESGVGDILRSLARAVSGLRMFTLAIGFVLLGCAFIPHIYYLSEYPSSNANIVVWITLAVWVVYGLVALLLGDARDSKGFRAPDAENKAHVRNGCYNILDLVAKNVMGILIAIIAWNRIDGADPCAASPPPPSS